MIWGLWLYMAVYVRIWLYMAVYATRGRIALKRTGCPTILPRALQRNLVEFEVYLLLIWESIWVLFSTQIVLKRTGGKLGTNLALQLYFCIFCVI